MILFSNFIVKYPEFAGEETKFNLFLPEALLEVELYHWGNLKSVATELLTAHKITLTKQSTGSDYSTGILKRLEVDDESYNIELQSVPDSYGQSKYGLEYQRLLKIVTNTSPESASPTKGTSIFGVRGSNPIKWSQSK